MEIFAIKHDRTLFSKLAAEFESCILLILSQASISGIHGHILEKFQIGYSPSAFRCRYPYCRTSSNGFASAALRRQHEASHSRRIYCTMTSCPWNRIGLQDQSALRNHIRTHHSKEIKSLATAKIRHLSDDTDVNAIQNQNRSRFGDDWPPVFSYKADLAEGYLDKISPNYVRQEEGWFAFFEPHRPGVLDIELLNTLPHPSAVVSAQFSPCGTYFATGCNRTVTVFNVATDAKIQECLLDGDDWGGIPIIKLSFHPDSNRFVCCGGTSSSVYVCDSSEEGFIMLIGKQIWRLDGALCNKCKLTNRLSLAWT